MLDRFLNFGIENKIFKAAKIVEIDKSCCISQECEIIDFDETAKTISCTQCLQTIASCDGLKICPNQNRIDFIELKGFEKFKKHQLSKLPQQEVEIEIKRQVESFDFEKKLRDSVYLLDTIIRMQAFTATSDEQKKFLSVKKRYFIATDITAENDGLSNFYITMSYLAESSSIDRQIEICIKNSLQAIDFDCYKIEKPQLTSCEN